MRLLADENLPLATIEALRQAGHDVSWVRTDHPGSKDTWLLELAEAEERVLLTLDKDFWQLTIQKRTPLHRGGVILFRVHPAISENITPLVLGALDTGKEWKGHASVVTVDGLLMLRLRGKGEASLESPS